MLSIVTGIIGIGLVTKGITNLSKNVLLMNDIRTELVQRGSYIFKNSAVRLHLVRPNEFYYIRISRMTSTFRSEKVLDFVYTTAPEAHPVTDQTEWKVKNHYEHATHQFLHFENLSHYFDLHDIRPTTTTASLLREKTQYGIFTAHIHRPLSGPLYKRVSNKENKEYIELVSDDPKDVIRSIRKWADVEYLILGGILLQIPAFSLYFL